MPKIQGKSHLSITIPKEIARLAGWKKGMVLNFSIEGDIVVLRIVD